MKLDVQSALFSRKPGLNTMSKAQRPQSTESNSLNIECFSYHRDGEKFFRLGANVRRESEKKMSKGLLWAIEEIQAGVQMGVAETS